MLTLFCKQIDDARLKSGCVTFNDVLDVWLACNISANGQQSLRIATGNCLAVQVDSTVRCNFCIFVQGTVIQ